MCVSNVSNSSRGLSQKLQRQQWDTSSYDGKEQQQLVLTTAAKAGTQCSVLIWNAAVVSCCSCGVADAG
jgi:hypothetical protein